jgi:archaellum component FlaC
MSNTLSSLVRRQILAEGPQLGDECTTQAQAEYVREEYVNAQLDSMTRAELLDRISDALGELQKPHDRRIWM